MNHKEYNGWWNYETWLCNLHISQDQYTQEHAEELARDADDARSLEYALSDWVCEMLDQDGLSIFQRDMMLAAIGEINLREIAEHYIDDLEDEDEDEDEEQSE